MVLKTRLFIIGVFIICILILLWLLTSIPSSELSEDKFVEVYVQLSMATEMFAHDTLKLEKEKKRIFEQAGVTQDEIDDFAKRCDQKPDRWAKVWKKIVEKLERKRQDLKL